MSLAELSTMMSCTRCGLCKHFKDSWTRACPSGTKYQSEMYYSSGRSWLAEALVDGRINLDQKAAEYIYSCALCRACAEMCTVSYRDIAMEVFLGLREECVENGIIPLQVKEFLENMIRHGNPYGLARNKRGDWAEGAGIPEYEKGVEFLYYVGDTGSYDNISQENARGLGEIFLKAGLSFGILGDKEISDGNEVRNLGEIGLFEDLVEKQSQLFKDLDVRKIVTLSPHSYNVFRNEYPKHGVQVEVFHYTQLLRNLLKDEKLSVSKGFNARVTYHDPCYLGRWNKEYDAPREILGAIPGINLLEMERNKDMAWCCGGGGGNFYVGLLSGEKSAAGLRVQEAAETGAKVLAVACPICTVMFSDAIQEENLEDKLKVMDISRIVREACE